MKRTAIRLTDIACRDHLAWAFWRAALGKRHRPDVQRFASSLDVHLDRLRADILDESIELGRFSSFEIHDPKRRAIHAPCFRERVLHHALTARVEPVFDRYLIDDTFACRVGKGSWAAALRAQQHARRAPWFLKIDMRGYFASIDHGLVSQMIRRRIKGRGVLSLFDRILATYCDGKGRGLPIGSLTSQHLANLYLSPLDRFLLEKAKVVGLVRYMDDVVVWQRDRSSLLQLLEQVRMFVARKLRLEIKSNWLIQASHRGVTLCGYRVYPRRFAMTKRLRRRYRLVRNRWESAFRAGSIDANQLQAGYSSALAMTRRTRSTHWRQLDLRHVLPVDA